VLTFEAERRGFDHHPRGQRRPVGRLTAVARELDEHDAVGAACRAAVTGEQLLEAVCVDLWPLLEHQLGGEGRDQALPNDLEDLHAALVAAGDLGVQLLERPARRQVRRRRRFGLPRPGAQRPHHHHHRQHHHQAQAFHAVCG
jgi:hypothetical protein